MLQNGVTRIKGGEKKMKHKHSKIGKYGIKWEPVEGYKEKDGKIVLPRMKKVEFKWKNN